MMQLAEANTAHSFYIVYESLPEKVQDEFLKELVLHKRKKLLELTNKPNLSNFQSFLLNSPEMSDEELQQIQEKREHLNQWK
jgi:hypothetical protein